MRAKFHAESVTKHSLGGTTVFFSPVRKGTQENTQFWESTPFGKIELTITNPNSQDFFKPGKEYYVDFSEAKNDLYTLPSDKT